MGICAYLNFKDISEDVMNFYAKVFGNATIEITRFKDMPPDPDFKVPEAIKEGVMHGLLTFGDEMMMFSDVPEGMGQPLVVGNNVTLMYDSEDYDHLKGIYDAFCEGGQIMMPFGKTFWSSGYGYVVDKFGIGWQLNCNCEME